PRYHVVGIGGAGMSAIARLLLARGDVVSGSDRGHWPLADALARDGARVATSFDAANVAGADVVVRSSAYGDANPEVAAAGAAVLNVEHDHVDVFPTVAEVRDAFAAFAGRIAPGGALVACADDPVVASLAEARRKRGQPTRTYGSVATAQYRVTAPEDRADGLAFTLALGSGATVPVV